MRLFPPPRPKPADANLRRTRRGLLFALGGGVPLGTVARATCSATSMASTPAPVDDAPPSSSPGVQAPPIVRRIGDTSGQRWPLRSLIGGKGALLADGSAETARIAGAFARIAEGAWCVGWNRPW